MIIKLKNKKELISDNKGWCFKHSGYDSELIKSLNSGESVEADKIPRPALEYVEEVNKKEEYE
tara:strand:+ start:323 stop:511 length:189 start_codon:yes stop_codon:yes gene_type:complete